MKYTKPWHADSSWAEDSWNTWLVVNAHSGLEYNLAFWEDRVEVEFFDEERSEEFAVEFGL